MTLLVYDHKPVSGLTISNVDADGNVWVLTNIASSLEAQVTDGTGFTAEWLFGDTELVLQVSLRFDSM